jgi:hypothetical protein
MAESSDELERHIADIRHDLKDNFSELQDKVKSTMDWRAQFEERPGTMIALAFGGGVLLSALLPRGRSPRRKVRERNRDVKSIRHEPASPARSRVDYDVKASKRSETWNALKGAVIGAAAGKLSEFIEELLPGSRTDYTTSRSGKNYERPGSSSGPSTWQKSNIPPSD